MAAPDSVIAALRRELAEIADGPASRGFGADALKVGGKIFAALSGGELLLKLPSARVAAMIAGGRGKPFSSGGRVMKEWVLAGTQHIAAWPVLAREAKAFVARGTSSGSS